MQATQVDAWGSSPVHIFIEDRNPKTSLPANAEAVAARSGSTRKGVSEVEVARYNCDDIMPAAHNKDNNLVMWDNYVTIMMACILPGEGNPSCCGITKADLGTLSLLYLFRVETDSLVL